MNEHTKWTNNQLRLGWLLLAAGLVVSAAGILLPLIAGDLPFNERIITGVGIVGTGLGAARLVQYGAAKRDAQTARRMAAEQWDERSQLLRARAGNRAYWISALLTYAGLMWVSFAQNGSLPMFSADALWFFLAAAVVLPLGVYIASLVYDQQHS